MSLRPLRLVRLPKRELPKKLTVVKPEESEPLLYEGDLELPVNGATGYASVLMDLKATADAGSETISELEAGTAFEVLEEVGDWWYVRAATESGWLRHLYCFINLPDVVPSIIYDNTNTYIK